MAMTLYEGTEAVSTTEHSATTDTAGPDTQTDEGMVQGFFDVSDMVEGDQLQIRVYEKARSGDTQRVVWEAILVGGQRDPIFATPALLLKHGWDFTLDALAGTITVNWSIRRVAT